MSTSVKLENGVMVEEAFLAGSDNKKIPSRPVKNVYEIADGFTLALGLRGKRTDITIRDLRQRPGDVKPHRATVRQLNGEIVDVYSGETKSFLTEGIVVAHK